jgi:hypothetical protein
MWYVFLSQEGQTSTYQKHDVDQRELINDGTGRRKKKDRKMDEVGETDICDVPHAFSPLDADADNARST